MFFFPQQQIAAIQKAKFQAWLNVTDKYMDGFQKLTQLNVQTVRTVISESENSTKADAGAGDVGEWQSNLLTQLPEKAASYNRHFRAIVSSTGEEIVRETRSQLESYGSQMNDILKTAVEKTSEASEKTAAALEANIKEATKASVEATAKASDELSKQALSQASEISHAAKGATDAAAHAVNKSSDKR